MPRWKKDYTGERRTASITFQVTPSERRVIDSVLAGMSLAEYCRRCCVKGAAGAPRIPLHEIRALDAQLRRAGNNLNQVAYHLNAGGDPRLENIDETIDGLKAALARIAAL